MSSSIEAALATQNRALREENEGLREEVSALRRQLGYAADFDFTLRCREAFDLTAGESRFLQALMGSKAVSRAALFDLYCGDKLDPPDPKIVDVFICKLRRKLSPHGITVETIWGQGYRLPVKDRAEINRLLETKQERAA